MLSISPTKNHQVIAELTEEVQNLHAKLYPEIFKPFNKVEMEKVFDSHLCSENYFAYVVKRDRVIIGCAVFFIKEVEENAFHYTLKTLSIEQICVLSKFQKSGTGKLLLQQAEKLAKKNGINRIELDHWSANVVAADFFRKNGYEIYREKLYKMV